jgi:hypothetical protein
MYHSEEAPVTAVIKSIRVVRFAGLVQETLNGEVEREQEREKNPESDDQELSAPCTEPGDLALKLNEDSRRIRADGYVASRVLILGQSYSSFLGSRRSPPEWHASWKNCYSLEDLPELRRIDAEYSARISDLCSSEVDRVRPIKSPSTVGQRYTDEEDNLFPDAATNNQAPNKDNDPIRFLGSNYCMGLAPSTTKIGDIIVRFWSCDVALVMRRDTCRYRLVGRGHVKDTRRAGPADDYALLLIISNEHENCSIDGISVDMDLHTLQKITASSR